MNLLTGLKAALSRFLPPPAADIPAETAAAPQPPAPVLKRGRPATSVAKALECLNENPSITSAELAARLSISRDYARTLLRRARPKIEARSAAAAPVARPEFPLRSIHLNRRAQVLRLHAAGGSAQRIAAELGIPPGEAEFIVKVDRILARNLGAENIS